jgi:hypothetical protein
LEDVSRDLSEGTNAEISWRDQGKHKKYHNLDQLPVKCRLNRQRYSSNIGRGGAFYSANECHITFVSNYHQQRILTEQRHYNMQ